MIAKMTDGYSLFAGIAFKSDPVPLRMHKLHSIHMLYRL